MHVREGPVGADCPHLFQIQASLTAFQLLLFADVLQKPIPKHLGDNLLQEDRDTLGRLVHIGEETSAALLSRLDVVRTELKISYSAMEYADFRRHRHLPKYDVSPEWVLHHLLQHEAEHRGQINLLKRKIKEASMNP